MELVIDITYLVMIYGHQQGVGQGKKKGVDIGVSTLNLITHKDRIKAQVGNSQNLLEALYDHNLTLFSCLPLFKCLIRDD